MKIKKRLLLTIGDPCGIGPEIILKIFQGKKLSPGSELFVIGSKKIFDHYSLLLDLEKLPENRIIEIPLPKNFKITPGQTNRSAGKISGHAIKLASEMCLKKEFHGMITLPISKESLNKAGYNFPGHTEMLTEITLSHNTVMILYSKKFSVATATGHIPLSEVSKKITPSNLFQKIVSVNNVFVKDFKIRNPKIAILSLNPHAGDGGLLGKEEVDIIGPVIEEMNSLGFNLRGPFPADAFFANRTYKKFDITVSMYHDQGLIPFKMISFEKGVNYTGGLNIIRTSPDHGTAFDISGLGKANPESTIEAIKLAEKLSG
ncbi:MAG: 4-hydroxythreonine-4-phosphate dehydrogenase PdxA [bacterium]|nr:4-hydroxythreonine-4-phosphate dehydrogenase PdxA [bacterium]